MTAGPSILEMCEAHLATAVRDGASDEYRRGVATVIAIFREPYGFMQMRDGFDEALAAVLSVAEQRADSVVGLSDPEAAWAIRHGRTAVTV